ncbi:3-oxoacyl-ACP reductase FabG [Nocardia terpenica]|uniref:3-oxoacyl-[acyl-carrier-protein] reductase MabA n=1 Tax=Nocardia terpenica TaxID=455432 RepID=A0A164I6I2_9NOCA|nr:beta-ketoacyl-ACP reductase [Nocardia terpenica]MBF6061659.1 3-oxoacyl-ACP reductase FabG [Nocardia terpenica]MBF6107546.1 3-oxoacyl-ACP reductase FabG [Nocardia terpenica]MBF6110079.1 3-oxoacyl-ACP reductase FabG [Nocardia terpenica]MBF6122409.1 3-oxoacyl-ACP reductase FabG [Nocardia terpenica]
MGQGHLGGEQVTTERPLAIVTGGARGIGAACAVRLAADGYDIAFCHRNPGTAAEAVETECAERGAAVFRAVCDIADAAAVDDFVRAAQQRFGDPAVLVAAAGITRDGLLIRATEDDWDRVLRTNLSGVRHICKAVVPGMMRRRAGSIVTLSSVAGLTAALGQSNYAATKAGIIGFGKALSAEVARFGVRVNAVAPGFIETEMTEALGPEALREARKTIPMRRFGAPREVAALVSFLASEEASYITGHTFCVDGGLAA